MKELGYLINKRFKEWVFTVGEDYTQEATNLVDALKQYGFSHLERFSDKETLIETIENDPEIFELLKSYILPLLYYLKGDAVGVDFNINKYIQFHEDRAIKDRKRMKEKYSLSQSEADKIKDKGLTMYMNYIDELKKIMSEGKTLE